MSEEADIPRWAGWLDEEVRGNGGGLRGNGGFSSGPCWLVAKANHRFGKGDLAVKDLMRFFGSETLSPSQRAGFILQAIGLNPHEPQHRDLRSPDYLTAERRRELAMLRDQLAELEE